VRYVPVKDEKHGVMMRIAFIFLGISWLIVPHSLQAEQTGRDQKVTDRAAFAALIQSHDLKRAFITLEVGLDGTIRGSAFGRQVSGDWSWQDGYFCRTLFWGKRNLGYNCQEVRRKDDTVTFQSDRGTGDHADFKRIPRGG
jgi:hypothetical protein